MKTLYIDCQMGAAGDMLSAALLELYSDPKSFLEEVNNLNIPGVQFFSSPLAKCGIVGTHIRVVVNGTEERCHTHSNNHEHTSEHSHHNHSKLCDIEHIVENLNLSSKVKKDVLAIYNIIGTAESYVHNVPITDIHFHEVGTMDAIADIVFVCMLIEKIEAEQIIVSPINVGSGHVLCAHGMLPVPAPATAHILKNVPIYSTDIKSELCTPTGAAILKHFATSFGNMPTMKTIAIGYGMGTKDFESANCVRILMGHTEEKENTITELSCNIDDENAESIAYATKCLRKAGAVEVYTIPVYMKKNRQGTLLCVLCNNKNKDEMIHQIFKHTTTLGIRENLYNRYTLERSTKIVTTPLGNVQKKYSKGYGVSHEKWEYDDIVRLAQEKNMSMEEVINIIEKN